MSRKRVITERDIRRAKADGKSSIDVGDAVVTPSAREVAATLRITLSPAAAAPRPEGRSTNTPTPRSARAGSAGQARPTTGAAGSARPARGAATSAGPAKPAEGSPAPSKSAGGPAASPKPAGGSAPGAGPRPSVAIGADHGGVTLKAAIAKRLRDLGHDVADVGTNSTDPVDYPDFAETVARMVGEGRAAFGIMVDGAGIGSCMAANKVARVRAAMCYDVTTAQNAREHNFANVLTLGAGLIGERLALAIVETFLATPTGAERHAARVAKIDALDKRG